MLERDRKSKKDIWYLSETMGRRTKLSQFFCLSPRQNIGFEWNKSYSPRGDLLSLFWWPSLNTIGANHASVNPIWVALPRHHRWQPDKEAVTASTSVGMYSSSCTHLGRSRWVTRVQWSHPKLPFFLCGAYLFSMYCLWIEPYIWIAMRNRLFPLT